MAKIRDIKSQHTHMDVTDLSEGLSPPKPDDEVAPAEPQTDGGAPSNSDPLLPQACTELVSLAKQAFQERRPKDCLVLTRVILTMDPNNKEAQVIENWVRSDLREDIEKVRATIQKAKQEHDTALFQRAEQMLRTIIKVDPHNEQVGPLLKEVHAAGSAKTTPAQPKPRTETPTSRASEESESVLKEEYPGYPPEPANRRALYSVLAILLVLAVIAFAWWKSSVATVKPPTDGTANESDKATDGADIPGKEGAQGVANDKAPPIAGNTSGDNASDLPGELSFIVVPASGVQMKIDGKAYAAIPESAELTPGTHQLQFSAAGYAPSTMTVSVVAGKHTTVPVMLKSLTAANDSKTNNPATPPDKNAPAAGSRADYGSLTVTSIVDVAIFEKDKPIGSTPVTLQLTPGPHTLEFRHEGLKKTIDYTIAAGSVQSVGVTFEITVNIQAKPFADVFIEGNPTPLGETPLFKIVVPVGGTLIFRHPKFPDKRYRVKSTDNANAILLNFP